jgi:sulfofructose kinase
VTTTATTSSPFDAVFVGAATFDVLALMSTFPARDERRVADELLIAGGGPAATAAVAFTRLGLRAAFVGAVGDDAEGERVRAGLCDADVDVSGLSTVPGRSTGASVIVVDHSSATRTILARPMPPLRLDPAGAGAQLIRSAPWVHADQLGWAAVSASLSEGDGARPRLSVDGGNPIDGFSPAGVHLYAPTEAELHRIHGPGDIDTLLDAALATGPAIVVASRGKDGSVAVTADGRRVAAPALPVDVVSTLGAGDVFHGALLAAMVRNEPLDRCLAYANTVAALSCRGLDGRAAIPDHEAALAALASLFAA